jgi:transposase
VQIRHDTAGRAYYRRKLTEGKTAMEALRCLKRRLSDTVYRQLVADANTADSAEEDAGPGGHSGATPQSSAADLHTPDVGSSDQPQPAPAPPTLPLRRPQPNPPRGLDSQPTAQARRSRQSGAPHRTNDPDGDKRRRTLKDAESAPLMR